MTHRFTTALLAPALFAALAGCATQAQAVEVDIPAMADFKSCTKPMYPKAALAEKRVGKVTIAYHIGLDGKTTDSKVTESSGHADLDESARQAISKCRFTPAIKDGQPVASWQPVQYVWTLK